MFMIKFILSVGLFLGKESLGRNLTGYLWTRKQIVIKLFPHLQVSFLSCGKTPPEDLQVITCTSFDNAVPLQRDICSIMTCHNCHCSAVPVFSTYSGARRSCSKMLFHCCCQQWWCLDDWNLAIPYNLMERKWGFLLEWHLLELSCILLKAEKPCFQWKKSLHTHTHTHKREAIEHDSKRSRLVLLKSLFWARSEDDVLVFARNLFLAVKALP